MRSVTSAAVIIFFTFIAQYARKETAVGVPLTPTTGTAKIFAPQRGTIKAVHVEQGTTVREGQPLLTIETDQITADGLDVNASMLNTLRSQMALIAENIKGEEQRTGSERERLTALIRGLGAEIVQLEGQIELQTERLKVVESDRDAANELKSRGFMSAVDFKRRQILVLEQKQAISALNQQVTVRKNQITETQFALGQLPTVMAQKVQALRNDLAWVDQRIAEVDDRRRAYIIRAPISGHISSLQASVGQPADPQRLQLQIVPAHSPLQAELFIPARAIGFVEVGQPVRILYDAFPYQHFGTYRGRVEKVSQTILTSSDVATPVTLREPAYRATVMLEQPDVDAFGKNSRCSPTCCCGPTSYSNGAPWWTGSSAHCSARGSRIIRRPAGLRRRPPSAEHPADRGGRVRPGLSGDGHQLLRPSHRPQHAAPPASRLAEGGDVARAYPGRQPDAPGLPAAALRTGRPGQLNLPAIVHWGMNHFVVLKSVSGKGIVVHDPATGVKTYRLQEASKYLTGVALELAPADGFTRKDEKFRLPLRVFWGRMQGISSPLVQIFTLSVILELLVVAAPFYMQLTVDEVVARGDVDLMLALALGFGLLTAINVATTALRSHIVLVAQNAVHFQMGARLFHHLVRLPLSFFEKRHIGDVLSRFNSIEPIRNALAEGMVLAVIDGIMALATLAMIFIYSARLALVVVTALLLYFIVRLALYRRFRDLSEATIQAAAVENTNFIETARAIQSVKLFNREADRESQWLNRHADTVNANIRQGRAQIHSGRSTPASSGWRTS